MEREQVLYEDGEYRVPSQGDIILNQAIEDFTKAIANQDFFEAVKKLGVIELFKTPDLPFFTGMAFQTDKQFQKSVEYYLQVPEKSIFYSSAMLGLARSYEVTGQYILLDELLKKRCFEISPIKELFSRQNCIEHMGIDDFINEYENLSQITAPQVDKMPQDPEEQEINYHIFRVFADMLVVAGECINQCVIYKKNVKDSGFDFDNYPETALFAKMYKKCVYILEYSKYVGYIQFSGSIESFAICALSDKIWEEKLKIFTGTNYIQQIAQIIFDICKPERYPSVPPFVCLAGIMERYQHMAPTLVDGIIGAYFDIVSNAALAGDKTAWDYMGLSYSRILVTSEDPYKIKDKLDFFKTNNPSFDYDEILGNTVLTYKMSRKGHNALLNAEYTFDVTTRGNFGVRDASGLALIFFRVLEIEYNGKLIVPFAKSINFDDINRITDFEKPADRYNINKSFSRWGKDLEGLYDIQTGAKQSLEIGVIRTLLAHILHRSDACARYLLPILESFFTHQGKNAFYTEQILDVVGLTNVNMYRNPGAHTGFVTYSKACDAREYVKGILPIVETWFIEPQ
ncbi:MAG: hypothetical protein VZR24_15615 [Butyrivibrio hungatei]|jgi:hypothetical protein|nr:hypothetical protein [Butyrivibrio hungatei]